ncbi:unnamed protein product, partial [Timema podura]|nr:unnamed protein product [Timema podura]
MGRCLGDTMVQFQKAESSSINLVGKAKGKQVRQSIINPDWDFQKMGIGGLDKEFNAIFRRAFASRVFPPEVVEQLATLDGGLGYMLPVPEKTYRRLLMLQNVLVNHIAHTAGLNPKSFRPLALSSASLKPILWDCGREDERCGVA